MGALHSFLLRHSQERISPKSALLQEIFYIKTLWSAILKRLKFLNLS